MGILIDEKKDDIRVNGRKARLPDKLIYILLNKPKGYLCTVKDNFRRPTVLDLVGKDKKVFPVGRLDLDTQGVLLLTNDGELAYRLTHPKFQIEKTYLVTIKGEIDEKILKKFREGIKLDDGEIAKGEAKFLKIPPEAGLKIEKGNAVLEVKLKEGRKREIKRMCKAVGLPVVALVRTRFANLSVGSLGPKNWRYLKQKEIESLRKRGERRGM